MYALTCIHNLHRCETDFIPQTFHWGNQSCVLKIPIKKLCLYVTKPLAQTSQMDCAVVPRIQLYSPDMGEHIQGTDSHSHPQVILAEKVIWRILEETIFHYSSQRDRISLPFPLPHTPLSMLQLHIFPAYHTTEVYQASCWCEMDSWISKTNIFHKYFRREVIS